LARSRAGRRSPSGSGTRAVRLQLPGVRPCSSSASPRHPALSEAGIPMSRMARASVVFVHLSLLVAASEVAAQDEPPPKFEVYGFAQADYIQDFMRVNPAWVATLRPSRIPTVDGTFGQDGEATLSVRQSRFGVKGNHETEYGLLKTQF